MVSEKVLVHHFNWLQVSVFRIRSLQISNRQFGGFFLHGENYATTMPKAPAWAVGTKQTLKLGHHVFLKDVP
ncbi:hypothetical protein A1D17_06375 [Pseudomonas fluorescens]|uniref:Cell wall hydrolase SleB domain-containing protein n=1 Tax=Pseudomonas fluorescens TaxID=294 RepID=A0A161YY75_PSEFL|nr:hypothetical protein A1D17_06375 [Pseudomonas fluorescens]